MYEITDRTLAKKYLFDFINDNGITDYTELVDELLRWGRWELFDLATDNCYLVQNYLMGLRAKRGFETKKGSQPVE